MEQNDEKQNDFNESCRFIDALVQALQQYGVSSSAMVTALLRISKALGVKGEFLATPHYVQTVFWRDDEHQQRVHLSVSRSGNFNLSKLARVTRLAKLVEAGTIRVTEGLNQLREIVMTPPKYGPLTNALAFMLCGISFGIIIDTSWINALTGGVVALASYGVTRIAARLEGIAALQELLAAMIASFLSYAAAVFFHRVNPMAVTVLAVVWFIPGFGLTLAPRELILGNTLSGIVWLTNSLVATLKLFGGAAIGAAMAQGVGLGAASVSPGGDIAAGWAWCAVPVLIITLAVLMNADWRSFGAILLGGWLVWGAMKLGTPFGYWQGTFFGAVVLVLFANVCSSRFDLPSIVIILPCVMVLVPGLAALRVLHEFDTQGILAGFKAGYRVMVLIAAIIGGALVGDSVGLHNLLKTGKAMKSFIGWPDDHVHKEKLNAER